ncbi:MAG: thioesterase domain-containing protein [Muricomes sp.]
MGINKWIAHEHVKKENTLNLLCFIFDGGSASYFAPWKYKISDDINLIPILYPAREKRREEKMYENMEVFLEKLVVSLEKIFRGQYAFFGYCSGAVLAYETAALARALYGTEPVYGMIISSEAPEYLPGTVPVCTDQNKEELFYSHMSGLPTISKEMLHDKVFLNYYAPLITSDYDLLRTYSYREHEKFTCDFDVVMSPEDEKVERKKIEEWGKLTDGATTIFEKPGGHFLVESQAEFIFDRLNSRLSEKEKYNMKFSEVPQKEAETEHNDIEKKMIDIWKKILQTDEITLADSFFLKGGDSIKAARIVNAVKEEMGVSIDISDIIKNPEISTLSNYISDLLENEKSMTDSDMDEGEI